ncbi:hypothetical protein [Paenibacillus sp. NPDC057934]|uniref:hypothetical protein n=1 Tax=Paenibacillus sp. NPDC057934 TaxID=3346282 RepID=UPI0036D95524
MIGKVMDSIAASASRGQWKPGRAKFMNMAPGSTETAPSEKWIRHPIIGSFIASYGTDQVGWNRGRTC